MSRPYRRANVAVDNSRSPDIIADKIKAKREIPPARYYNRYTGRRRSKDIVVIRVLMRFRSRSKARININAQTITRRRAYGAYEYYDLLEKNDEEEKKK